MAPLTVISPQPEAVEFRVARDGSLNAWVKLRNTWSGQVAYKMKTTSPKDYTIKPASGSIRQGEFHDVQIIRKSPEEGGSPDSSKKVKFLVQAAGVTTQAQKLLLYAADKGKAAGRTKFWESIPKEDLQEQQLPVKMPSEEPEEFEDALEVPYDAEQSVDATISELWKARKARSQEFRGDDEADDGHVGGAGAGRGAAENFEAPHNNAGRKGDGRGDGAEAGERDRPDRMPVPRKGYGGGKLTDQDVDDIVGRMTKIGPDGKPVVQVLPRPTGSAPPGFEGPEPATSSPSLGPSPAPDVPAERKPLHLNTAHKAQRHDIVLQGHSRPVTYVAFDAAGKTLYTCGKDKLVIAWSVPDGECLRKYEGHRGAVWACSLNNDEGLLLTCGADNFVLLWEAASANLLYEVELPGVVRCVEWSHGLCLRFACCCNGFKAKPAAVSVFELSTLGAAVSSRCCTSIEVPTLPSAATQVAWAGPYWEWLCSLHDGGVIIFWNALTGSELTRLTAHKEMVSRIAFPNEGRLMVSCGRQDMEVRLWCLAREKEDNEGSDFEDLEGENPEPELMRNFVCDRALNCVAVRPSLTFADAASEDAEGGDCTVLAGGGQDARDVALVGAGTDVDQFEPLPLRFARVSDSGAPGLEHCPAEGPWDPKLRKGGHFGPIHALAFSPDARICASGSEDGNVRLREFS
ncbi:TIF34 [Symbiodinium sp. CCMP2592]|nr:TIF34 [Symbiodinium sp. CCMP2592]